MKGRKCVLVRQPPVESQFSAGRAPFELETRAPRRSEETFREVSTAGFALDTKPPPDASSLCRYTIHHGCTSALSWRFRNRAFS